MVMNAASTSSPPALCYFHDQRRRRIEPLTGQRRGVSPTQPPSLQISASLFSPRRRLRLGLRGRPPEPHPRNKPSTPERKVEVSVDIDDIAGRASAALTRLYRSSEARFHRFLSSGEEAYHDLRTSVWLDGSHRIVFSCRRSSLIFVANLFIWSLAAVAAVRALSWMGSGLAWGFGDRAVVRRDRSLSGREVVVGRRFKGRGAEETSFRDLVSPLSPARGTERKLGEPLSGRRVVKKEELPKWWPDSVPSPVISAGKQEYQREAETLVRAIMDRRMSGKDFMDDDIIQLRWICKVSGARVSFETANARDSFYRASVDLVLNSCIREAHPTATVLIDGEEARQFISGLAYNIGLENVHAARLVRAAVAARTRSSILQTWALEVQWRRPEALEELSKVCQIHRIFPPEEFSPEIEMVANGLKKNLGVEQRQHLLNLFKGVCGTENQRIVAEALGLMDSCQSEGNGDASASSLR